MKKLESVIEVERVQGSRGIAVIKFNNPAHLNALTGHIGSVFERRISELKNDDSLRVVILEGEGRAFSAGGDLDFLYNRAKCSASDNSRTMREFYQRFLTIRQLPVPTIAAINGVAVGAGLALAFACDIRVAADDARMGFNFVRIGIPPGMGSSYLLPFEAGRQVATKLLLTGDLISAQEALDYNLVLSLHKKAEVFPAALKIAERIASASPPAVRETTKTLRMVSLLFTFLFLLFYFILFSFFHFLSSSSYSHSN